MDIRAKVTILGLVFVLSTVFFWLAINQYLYQSRAQLAADMQVLPHSTDIKCNPQGECYLHILGSMADGDTIAGATGYVRYGEYLEPVRAEISGVCAQSSYGLDTPFQFDTSIQGIISFSNGAVKSDSELRGGNGCITTIVFKPVNVPSDPASTKIQLVSAGQDGTSWKIGGVSNGQKVSFNAQVDESTIEVTIDSTVPWPPEDNPVTPQVTGTPSTSVSPSVPPNGCTKTGDCNCDDAVDLIDWEALRSTIRSEGGSCDLNNDGQANAQDISIWLSNNELVPLIVVQ